METRGHWRLELELFEHGFWLKTSQTCEVDALGQSCFSKYEQKFQNSFKTIETGKVREMFKNKFGDQGGGIWRNAQQLNQNDNLISFNFSV